MMMDVKKAIVLCLLSLLFLASFDFGPDLPLTETMSETIRNNYEQLKSEIEADTGKSIGNFFDLKIDDVYSDLGLGYNFGNELDWTFENGKLRRYKLKFSLGYDDFEYYTYESYAGPLGDLYNGENHLDASQPYVNLRLFPSQPVLPFDPAPINTLKLFVSNDYPAAQGTELTIYVNCLKLLNSRGLNVLQDGALQQEYTVQVSSEPSLVFSIPLDAAAGDFYGPGAGLQADLQLDHFISDYKDDPALLYEEVYNGEPATDAELLFLKEQGFRTIRLPVTWFSHMDASGTVDLEWFAEVNRIVERILSHGFYVIVNIHHDSGKSGWIKADETDFERHEYLYRYLVLQIAENFKHYDERLILGGPNELTNLEKKERINAQTNSSDAAAFESIQRIFVEEVRRTGYNNSSRFLMLSPWYAYRMNLQWFQMPPDSSADRIFMEIHDYRADRENTLNTLMFLREEGAEYLDRFRIVMGEFSFPRLKSTGERIAVMESSMKLARELGIPMILWDDGGDHAMMRSDPVGWDTDYDSDLAAEAMISSYYSE